MLAFLVYFYSLLVLGREENKCGYFLQQGLTSFLDVNFFSISKCKLSHCTD